MEAFSFDPDVLWEDAHRRRDIRPTFSNPADRRWVSTAFRHRRVLLSSARIKAEAFLWQN